MGKGLIRKLGGKKPTGRGTYGSVIKVNLCLGFNQLGTTL
jgi:hypothetical protein